MCGIFALLNNNSTFTPSYVDEQFKKGKNRGPDNSKLTQVGLKIMMGFHRLAINGMTSDSNQPMIDGDIVLICDGEIYNYRELYQYANLQAKNESDCEVIIHLYRKFGIEHTIQLLDGVYSFILLDNSLGEDNFKAFVVRDSYGLRPLYMLQPSPGAVFTEQEDQIFAFASDLSVLYDFYKQLTTPPPSEKPKKSKKALAAAAVAAGSRYNVQMFKPGHYSKYSLSSKSIGSWKVEVDQFRYHSMGYNSIMYHLSPQYHEKEIVLNIQRYLIRAIEKMCSSTQRPMISMLSGGADSSIITGLVRQYHVTHGLPQLETCCIGFENSEDMLHAKLVSNVLGTKHIEIVITEEELLNAIPETIRALETYDMMTIRTGVLNYIMSKRMSEQSSAKVVFTGDGANDVTGGHLYMYLARDSMEFDRECRRLINEIHYYDNLRVDKAAGHFGLEVRTPFMDRAFVQYYMSIPPQVRFHTRNDQCEKFLLRLAFSSEFYRNSVDAPMLPDEVLWRTTEAFGDGTTPRERSLHEIIQNHALKLFADEYASKCADIPDGLNRFSEMAKRDPAMQHMHDHLLPKTAEQFWYRREFEKAYGGLGKLVPTYWMPRYAPNVYDPSARTLDIYKDDVDEEDDLKGLAMEVQPPPRSKSDLQLQELPPTHVINTENGQIIESTESNSNGMPLFRIEEVIRDGENGSKEHDINIHINL